MIPLTIGFFVASANAEAFLDLKPDSLLGCAFFSDVNSDLSDQIAELQEHSVVLHEVLDVESKTLKNCRLSVRQSLAQNTRLAHLELHKHKWVAALAGKSITSCCYHRVLTAYLEFYRHVELHRARFALFPQLSLNNSIEDLKQDVNGTPLFSVCVDRAIALKLADKPSVLGALYVLHGAGFGASILNKNIKRNLPTVTGRLFENKLIEPKAAPRERDIFAGLPSVSFPRNNGELRYIEQLFTSIDTKI